MIDRSAFGPRFAWGVSSSAYQTEGAASAEGKGPSIWDLFTEKKKLPGAATACDFYNRYVRDIILIEYLQLRHFRTSISWSRLLPEGTGRVNPKGLDFYDRMIDFCLGCGITPWLTLYHWDLPQALEERGGWTSRDIVNYFTDYAALCARKFGDRVKHWMVLNEPVVFAGAGHLLGLHAPGRRGLSNFLPALHHAALCQAEGARALRAQRADLFVGTTQSFTHIDPLDDSRQHREAAHRADLVANRLFLEPLLGKGYPWDELPVLRQLQDYMLPGDEDRLACPLDFLGVQQYTRELVRHAPLIPYLQARTVKAAERGMPHTEMGWEIYPEGLYQILRKLSAYPGMPQLVITENGAAFPDKPENGSVHDPQRIAYFEAHLAQLARAIRDGARVSGYFAWSLTDNFEWAEGCRPRFGLVHVDYKTQRRTIKDSGYWYRSFVAAMQGEQRKAG